MNFKIYYKTDGDLLHKKVLSFLESIDTDFPVALSMKTDLKTYTKKLCDKAYIITCEKNNLIKGMLAGYVDDTEDNIAYISLLGVCSEERNKGIAGRMLREFVVACREKGMNGIHVYAVRENIAAMEVYKQNGFVRYVVVNESRPSDEHLFLKL